jgi:hypothetical protein
VRAVKSRRRVEKEKEVLIEKGYIDSGIVSETSKYAVKSGDYLFKNDKDLTSKVVGMLELTSRRRRLSAFGGLLKKVYKNLEEEKKIEDAESEKMDLVCISCGLSS